MIVTRPLEISAGCFDEITESGYSIVSTNELNRLKRLDENVKKTIKDAKELPGYFDSIIGLLESLDK